MFLVNMEVSRAYKEHQRGEFRFVACNG